MRKNKDIKGIIYKYTSPSGKSYIGQTLYPNQRKYQHKRAAIKGHISKFCDAIRKYGWDAFIYEVLFTTSEQNPDIREDILNEQEVYFIKIFDSFNNEYNETIGGKVLSGKNHPSYGTHLTKEHAEKLKRSRAKEVSQYDLNGNYIQTFDSAAHASLHTGCDSSQIIAICRGKAYTSKEYQWRYGNSKENIGTPNIPKNKGALGRVGKLNAKSKEIYQYTLQGQLVNIWESALCAERASKFQSVHLSRAINKQKPYGKKDDIKYFWSFIPLTEEQVQKKVKRYNDKKARAANKKSTTIKI